MADPALTASVKQAFSQIPSYLQVNAIYSIVSDSGDYDPMVDSRSEATESRNVILIRGQSVKTSARTSSFLSEDTPVLGDSYTCEARLFDTLTPSLRGSFQIGEKYYIVSSIITDPALLTYRFTLEENNGT